jgi:salicylate hydroxylase
MTMNTTSPLRFAIIGGGIAGAAVANALIGITNLDIHVFESASEFSERGAAVGLAINAQRALAQIVPSATELLDKAGAVDMNSTQRFLVSTYSGVRCSLT